MKRSPAQQLETLRRFRNAKPDRSIGRDVDAITKGVSRARAASGGLDGAWAELVPPAIAPLARVQRVTPGGLVTLAVRDSAAMYEVDLWLRDGGLAALRARCAVPVRRVRLVLGGRP